MKVRCKCHGLSGSCQLRTCWKSAPDFHIVGKELMQLFQTAILVDQSNLASSELIINANQPKHRRIAKRNHSRIAYKKSSNNRVNAGMHKKSLYYYQRSPNFCEADSSSDIPGNNSLLHYKRMRTRFIVLSRARYSTFMCMTGQSSNVIVGIYVL